MLTRKKLSLPRRNTIFFFILYGIRELLCHETASCRLSGATITRAVTGPSTGRSSFCAQSSALPGTTSSRFAEWGINLLRKPESFRSRLLASFLPFILLIFGSLWILETVLLQRFYNAMVIRNTEKQAENLAELCTSAASEEALRSALDASAAANSLLIFLTDTDGNMLLSTDEHSGLYRENRDSYEDRRAAESKTGQTDASGDADLPDETASSLPSGNPYLSQAGPLNWQIGASRYLSLPGDYDAFLSALKSAPDGRIHYTSADGTSFICGILLPGRSSFSEAGAASSGTSAAFLNTGAALLVSTSLQEVSAAAGILRILLLVVTGIALMFSALLAWILARRFAGPVSSLSREAGKIAEGNFDVHFDTGFCAELDGLALTMQRTAQTLQRSETFRREFFANISHDLRTPLTMIRGYAEMVRDISPEDPEERRENLDIVIREADRLSALVNEILEYSSLQAGSAQMRKEEFDLRGICGEVLRQFEPLCAKQGFTLSTDMPDPLPVFGDRAELSRVLYNLLDNAVSHSEKNGTIALSARRDHGRVRVQVINGGPGIAPEDLPYVWERYFTLKQSGRNKKGSGLGLAISREILLAHGAAFSAESRDGRTVFWFELPAPPKCTPG